MALSGSDDQPCLYNGSGAGFRALGFRVRFFGFRV